MAIFGAYFDADDDGGSYGFKMPSLQPPKLKGLHPLPMLASVSSRVLRPEIRSPEHWSVQRLEHRLERLVTKWRRQYSRGSSSRFNTEDEIMTVIENLFSAVAEWEAPDSVMQIAPYFRRDDE